MMSLFVVGEPNIVCLTCYKSKTLTGNLKHSICLYINHRHPQSSSRPAATDVVLALMENEEVVLRVPKDDAATDRLAGVIGAPLKAGEHMYPELQEMYFSVHMSTL